MRKNSKLHKFNNWKQHTWQGLLVAALVELALAYGFGSWAIDNGSLLTYAVTLLFLIGFIRNTVKLIKVLIHGKPQAGAARRATK